MLKTEAIPTGVTRVGGGLLLSNTFCILLVQVYHL